MKSTRLNYPVVEAPEYMPNYWAFCTRGSIEVYADKEEILIVAQSRNGTFGLYRVIPDDAVETSDVRGIILKMKQRSLIIEAGTFHLKLNAEDESSEVFEKLELCVLSHVNANSTPMTALDEEGFIILHPKHRVNGPNSVKSLTILSKNRWYDPVLEVTGIGIGPKDTVANRMVQDIAAFAGVVENQRVSVDYFSKRYRRAYTSVEIKDYLKHAALIESVSNPLGVSEWSIEQRELLSAILLHNTECARKNPPKQSIARDLDGMDYFDF